MKRSMIVPGIFLGLLICLLVAGAMTLLGGGPKEVYLYSSLQKFFPNPPRSVFDELDTSYTDWNTKQTLWSNGEVQSDYLKVCPTPLMLGCSWVKTWSIDSFKTDPVIRQKASVYSSSSSDNTGMIIVVLIVIAIVVVLLFWQPWKPKVPPMTAADARQAAADYKTQLEIRDREGSIMERRKRQGIPWWWPRDW